MYVCVKGRSFECALLGSALRSFEINFSNKTYLIKSYEYSTFMGKCRKKFILNFYSYLYSLRFQKVFIQTKIKPYKNTIKWRH